MRVSRAGSPVRKYRKDSRTIPERKARRPVYENRENEEYFRCWNCGFPCKKGREDEGGSNTPARISYTENSDYTATDFFPDYVWYDITGGGCPFCHSPNWQGKY